MAAIRGFLANICEILPRPAKSGAAVRTVLLPVLLLQRAVFFTPDHTIIASLHIYFSCYHPSFFHEIASACRIISIPFAESLNIISNIKSRFAHSFCHSFAHSFAHSLTPSLTYYLQLC